MILIFLTGYALIACEVFVDPHPALAGVIHYDHARTHQECAELQRQSFVAHQAFLKEIELFEERQLLQFSQFYRKLFHLDIDLAALLSLTNHAALRDLHDG